MVAEVGIGDVVAEEDVGEGGGEDRDVGERSGVMVL